MLRHNCLRNAQNIIKKKETLSTELSYLKKEDCRNKNTLSQLKQEGAQDLQVATKDYIPVTKTQNSVATQLLGRDREGKSGP